MFAPKLYRDSSDSDEIPSLCAIANREPRGKAQTDPAKRQGSLFVGSPNYELGCISLDSDVVFMHGLERRERRKRVFERKRSFLHYLYISD